MSDSRWQRVEEIFHQAAELAPGARSAFLDEVCAGDESLRREIESLLAHDAEDGSTLANAVAGAARDATPKVEDLSGRTIGPYQVLGRIGAGGMGVVYKASDTRLGRSVALKFVKDQFSRRSQREARAAAALNHPNICTLHDVGPNYLVMELIEGPTLAERMAKGPIPLKETLEIARQVADALEAAHEKGVVHRDLKPANIKLTAEGTVKVLDFGLAKAQEPAAGSAEDSPTPTGSATEAGVILGTAAYMSPEQASGKAVDKRADIWSFGVVLWELLTGHRLFEGDTVAHTLAEVLRGPIDFDQLPRETPAAIRGLLRRCLDRDVKNRLRDIGEARIALQEYLANPADDAVAAPAHRKTAWAAGAAALALIATVASFGWWKATRAVERPLVQLEVDLGSAYSGDEVIISPDGGRLVFVSKRRLFTRRLNQPKATELAGTEGAEGPFFSPDGQWVAFSSGGQLKKISVEGGAAIVLCDAPAVRGGAWGEDHSIIAALTTRDGLSRIPDAGGAPQRLTELARGEYTHRWPQILPGGKAVLFTASTTAGLFDEANIEVMSFENRRRKTLHRGGTYGRYLPTSNGAGHLVYINKGTLFAVAFNPDTLEVRGTPSPVVQAVSQNPATGFAQFDFSRDGTLVYRRGGAGGMAALEWLDGKGKFESLAAKPGTYRELRLSPDGKLVALTVPSGNGSDIWTYDWQRDAMSRLTFGDGAFKCPVWSIDGRYLAFSADSEMFWTRADGAGKPQPLTRSKAVQWPWSFSPDGKRLAFAEFGSGNGELWTVPVENEGGALGAGKPELFLQSAASETSPAFSPDGRWMAYVSDDGVGNVEIYVRAFPDKGGKWQISNSGGAFAIWSRNGHELFYRTLDQQIMVASYTTKADLFMPDKPRLWSSTRLADTGVLQNLDISPDGQRFIALMPSEAAGQQRANNQVTFLLNFFDEVRRRAGVAKQ